MKQVIAIANVVAWAGFWAFGYLALTAGQGVVSARQCRPRGAGQ